MVDSSRIRQLMESKGIKNKELASSAGISEAMMTYIAKGMREPTATCLGRIAHTLGVTVDSLIIIHERE